MPANLENSAVATGLENVNVHSNPKECSNYHTLVLISCVSKFILKILQARLQQHVNPELPEIPAGFRKGRGTRDQIANIRWIIEKDMEFQKNIYFYTKAFDCVDYNKLFKILKEIEIPDHPTSLQRNLYAGQEATVSTGHGTMNWFKIGKRVCQGCISSPAYLTYLQSTSCKCWAGRSISWNQNFQEKYQLHVGR